MPDPSDYHHNELTERVSRTRSQQAPHSSSDTLTHTETQKDIESRLDKASRTILQPRRTDTVLSQIRSRKPVAPFTHPLAAEKTSDAELVEFEGRDDPYRPLNWLAKKKVVTTALYGMTTMGATFASSSYSAGQGKISEQYHISTLVAGLGTALFMVGFGLGPLLWAPLSEVFGRKKAVLPPYFIAACLSFATGVSKDVESIMIARFWTGFFASAPVTNTGGVLADLYTPDKRGIAMAGYAMAVVIGPIFGPICGSAIIVNDGSWRWTEYMTGVLMLIILIADIIFVDESYPQVLLVSKARKLRISTGNWALHAQFEEWDISISELAHKFLIKPFELMTSPICILMCFYASFCYGILYMQLAAIPYVFGHQRHWNDFVATLPFLGMLVGVILSACLNVYNQHLYNVKYHANGDRAVPEARLLPMQIGSPFFAGGLFVTAWTADSKFTWIAPVIGIGMLGFGFLSIFQSALNYLVDTFTRNSASAICVNTFLRSCFECAFPLISDIIFDSIGVDWGLSIFGFCAVALIPMPFFFSIYGQRIRAMNRWSADSVTPGPQISKA